MQHHMMGSRQPPADASLPFGYTFESTLDDSRALLFLDPPDQPQGAPLLSEDDAQVLNSFFEELSSDHYQNTSFGEGLTVGANEWANLPPHLLATATCLGDQAAANLGSSHRGASMTFSEYLGHGTFMPPPPPPPPPLPAPQNPAPDGHLSPHVVRSIPTDVFAAAALGSMSRPHTSDGLHVRNMPLGLPADHPRRRPTPLDLSCPPQDHRSASHLNIELADDNVQFPPLLSPAATTRQTAPRTSLYEQRAAHPYPAGPLDGTDDVPLAETLPSRHPTITPSRHPTITPSRHPTITHSVTPAINGSAEEMQWGSDARFSDSNAFVPASDKETSETLENFSLEYIGLGHAESNPHSCPPSPAPNEQASPLSPIVDTRIQSTPFQASPDSVSRPKKRETNEPEGGVNQDDDSDEGKPHSQSARKRKPTANVGATGAQPHVTNKRRKSNGHGASKPTRENLTEDQKRENHIKSEQKRRSHITQGYAELHALVPELQGNRVAKSVALSVGADWLEDLIKGNLELMQQAGECGALTS